MRKIFIIFNIFFIIFTLGCNKDDTNWEEIFTDEVIENIKNELDITNKIFLNVISQNKMIVPLEIESNPIIWEFDKNFLELNENTFVPKKNGTTIISGQVNDKKNIFVITIENYKYKKTSQYNLDINYYFTTNSKKIGPKLTPEKIVIHNTANTATAKNEIKWLSNKTNTSSTSFHFAIDDKEIWQGVSTNNAAYHAGEINTNLKSIGIEIAKSNSNDNTIKDKAIENAIKFITILMYNYQIDITNIITHQDANGKHCPHDIFDRYGIKRFYNELIENAKSTIL